MAIEKITLDEDGREEDANPSPEALAAPGVPGSGGGAQVIEPEEPAAPAAATPTTVEPATPVTVEEEIFNAGGVPPVVETPADDLPFFSDEYPDIEGMSDDDLTVELDTVAERASQAAQAHQTLTDLDRPLDSDQKDFIVELAKAGYHPGSDVEIAPAPAADAGTGRPAVMEPEVPQQSATPVDNELTKKLDALSAQVTSLTAERDSQKAAREAALQEKKVETHRRRVADFTARSLAAGIHQGALSDGWNHINRMRTTDPSLKSASLPVLLAKLKEAKPFLFGEVPAAPASPETPATPDEPERDIYDFAPRAPSRGQTPPDQPVNVPVRRGPPKTDEEALERFRETAASSGVFDD